MATAEGPTLNGSILIKLDSEDEALELGTFELAVPLDIKHDGNGEVSVSPDVMAAIRRLGESLTHVGLEEGDDDGESDSR